MKMIVVLTVPFASLSGFQAKMPVDADWKDLLVYTDRERKITYKEGAHNVPTSIFPVFEGRCPRQWVLPNLTHLVWKCDTPPGLDRRKIFLSTSLQPRCLLTLDQFSRLSISLKRMRWSMTKRIL